MESLELRIYILHFNFVDYGRRQVCTVYYIDVRFRMSYIQSSFEAVYLSLSFCGLCMFVCVLVFLIPKLQSVLCASMQCKLFVYCWLPISPKCVRIF